MFCDGVCFDRTSSCCVLCSLGQALGSLDKFRGESHSAVLCSRRGTQVVLTFSFLDILNAFLNLVCRSQKQNSSSSKRLRVVSSPSQICLVLVVTVAMGLVFGIVFGVYDVEDDSSQIRWHKDNETTFPMGMIGGGITGFSVYMCVVFNDVCARSSS